MKNIENKTSVYLSEFDIRIKPYLTYAEIQAISDAIHKFDTWSEREQNRDILLLHFATNLEDSDIEKIGADTLYCSGLVDAVKNNIVNYNKIEESLEYTESIQRSLIQIIKIANKNLMVNKNATSKK